MLIEAFAEELEAFYHTMFTGILEASNEAVYNSFDFPLNPATPASGNVILSLTTSGSNPVPLAPTTTFTIPRGFRVQIPVQNVSSISASALPGTTYAVSSSTNWVAGQTSVKLPVACTQSGIISNTSQNSITGIVDILPTIAGGIYSVTNPLPFVNGEEIESESSRKARFARYLQSLGRGTLVAIENAALTAVVSDSNGAIQEQVKKVVAVEPFKLDGSLPVGHVDVIVFNGTGGTSTTLVSAAQQIIDGFTDINGNRISGYKAAGIIAKVKAAIEQPQTFNVLVKMLPNFSLTADIVSQIQSAVTKYVSTLNPGDTLIFNKIIELLMEVPGIYNCVVASPNGDIIPPDISHIITVNSITVTEDSSIATLSETFIS